MKTFAALSAVLFVATLASCSDPGPASPCADALIGSWGFVSHDSETGISVYERIDTLDGQRSGYGFEPGGVLLVRTSGWCGTPPLSYSNLEGTWRAESEHRLMLDYPARGGTGRCTLQILGVDDETLECRRISTPR